MIQSILTWCFESVSKWCKSWNINEMNSIIILYARSFLYKFQHNPGCTDLSSQNQARLWNLRQLTEIGPFIVHDLSWLTGPLFRLGSRNTFSQRSQLTIFHAKIRLTMLTQPPPFYVWADTQMLSVESERCHFPTWWPPGFRWQLQIIQHVSFTGLCYSAVPSKNTKTPQKQRKTTLKQQLFQQLYFYLQFLQQCNLYQHLQFPSLSICNCGSPNLRCGPAVPSSLDSSPLLRCCLALCCLAALNLHPPRHAKKLEKHLKVGLFFFKMWLWKQLRMCIYVSIYIYIIEGSLNSKLPTIWRVEKQMKSR